jgi:periodic tryptophan protein 2
VVGLKFFNIIPKWFGIFITSLTFSADNKKLYVGTLSGTVAIWDIEDSQLQFTIDSAQDIRGGRLRDEKMTALKSSRNKYFNSIDMHPSNQFLIGVGNSKYTCLYHSSQRVLMKRFILTNNRSVSGVLEKLNSKKINEFGELDQSESDDDHLPGAKRPVNFKRLKNIEMKAKCIKFSPDGLSFAVATSEGIQIFSIDRTKDIELARSVTLNCTVQNAVQSFKDEKYTEALLIGLSLGHKLLISKLLECTPMANIPLIIGSVTYDSLLPLINALSDALEEHGQLLREPKLQIAVRRMESIMSNIYESSYKLWEKNNSMLSFYLNACAFEEATDDSSK